MKFLIEVATYLIIEADTIEDADNEALDITDLSDNDLGDTDFLENQVLTSRKADLEE